MYLSKGENILFHILWFCPRYNKYISIFSEEIEQEIGSNRDRDKEIQREREREREKYCKTK